MAGTRVFISSTCVDLDAYRYQLRALLERLGYEPIMSDHSEVLYDPGLHTHASCLREIEASDILILLVGSRFGGTTVPQALPMIDFEHLRKLSTSSNILNEKDKISITQAEALKAVILERPIFTFVDSKVYADHHFYQTNKGNPALSQLKFPSITKQESATSVFEFINFMTHRSFNNAVIPFASFSDIETHLIKQWSLLFQRLLQEKRDKTVEAKKSIDVIDRIEELKAAVLQVVPAGQARDIARAVTRYGTLADFLYRLGKTGIANGAVTFEGSLNELLWKDGVVDIIWDDNFESPYHAILILKDGGFVGCFSYSDDDIKENFFNIWPQFQKLDENIKRAVLESALEISEDKRPFERHSESFSDYSTAMFESETTKPANVTRPRRRRSPGTPA